MGRVIVANGLRLTPGRLAWLERLEREGWAHRTTGRVAYDCMQAELTDWRYRAGEEVFTTDQAWVHFGQSYWEHVTFDGEMLTDAGHEALARARGSHA